MDSIPQISLGTAALLIFGAIASLAVLRGLIRILWGTTVLCLAGFVAFHLWNHAPAISSQFIGRDLPALSWVLPAVGFLLSAFLLRFLAKTFFAPLRHPNEEAAHQNRRSPVRWAITLLLSLVPTSAVWFFGATFLRHAGSVAEIRSFVDTHNLPDHTPFLAKIKESIDRALPSDWFATIDPLTSSSRLNLVKLIATADNPPPKAVAVLEESAIRDLVLSDPQLRELARQGRYSEILRDPRLDRLLENDNLREVLSHADL